MRNTETSKADDGR